MKNTSQSSNRSRAAAGFTMLEMLIALGMFLVISSAAFSLFSQHQPLFNQQQNLSALNISLRNSVAQIQMDMVNGGSGYYQSMNSAYWPIGVAITNNSVASGGDCRAGTPLAYGQNCFDQVAIIVGDSSVTPVNILADNAADFPVTAGTCTSNNISSTNTSLFFAPPAGVTAATYAASFHTGDYVLLTAIDGSQYTITPLTANGATQTISGTTYVKLVHTATNANGSNASTTDLTGATVYPVGASPTTPKTLTSAFCPNAWIVRLVPILYDVDYSTATDPKLRRTVLVGGSTPSTAGSVVAEQIIGFKVMVSLRNDPLNTDSTNFYYKASTYVDGSGVNDNYDFTLVRSVMVSIIGRTTPQTDPTYVFRNTFDGGAYETQGISVVINPRNMSMAD